MAFRSLPQESSPAAAVSLFDSDEYKHLLTHSINEMSMKFQKEFATTSAAMPKGNYVILKLDTDSIDYIEKINLNVLQAILVDESTRTRLKSPESECALVMTSIINTALSNFNVNKCLYPLTDLESVIVRIKEVLPRAYAEEACLKAQHMIELCQKVFSQSKKAKLLKAFMALPIPSFSQTMSYHSLKLNQQFFAELMQYFTFPLERFHNIFCSLYKSKIDIYITIYLVSVLEHITHDILHLSTNYVSYLKKYTIAKRDVCTAIHAVHNLIKIANLDQQHVRSSNADEYDDYLDDRSENDDDDDDDDEEESAEAELGDDVMHEISHEGGGGSSDGAAPQNFDYNTDISDSISCNSFSITNTNFCRNKQQQQHSNDGTSTSNDDGTSDSSTICAESTSTEHLNSKYIRKKFAPAQSQIEDLMERIFGNINDVYECALRLADLIDDSSLESSSSGGGTGSNSGSSAAATASVAVNETTSSALSLQLVGQHFWELCEGAEFDVYLKYALCVTNYQEVLTAIKTVLTGDGVSVNLEKTSVGLTLISKYLLPKLLLGSLYHVLYMYETIEYLAGLSIDDEDKIYLNNSLDTLKPIKYKLKEYGLMNSKQRPIETSFRIFQPHQLQSFSNIHTPDSNSHSSIPTLDSKPSLLLSNKSLNSMSQKSTQSISSLISQRSTAFAYNINRLTEKKWADLGIYVDSLKLPSSTKLSSIRYSYLYEGSLRFSRYESAKKSKPKVSSRYAFLFDGLLILLKKQLPMQTQSTTAKMFKFKQSIYLDKYFLNDSDDPLSFSFSSTSSNHHGDRERLCFSCNPNEKTRWMSMMCYSKYKLTIERLLQTLIEEQNKNNPLPKPPEDYIFDKADSPENILFEQQISGQSISDSNKSKKLDQDEQIIADLSSIDALSIKAATLIKLVERLTHHLYLHPKLSSTFLMFFREFCTPQELLSLLAKRYDVPDLTLERIAQLNYNYSSGSITERELLKRYRREYQEPIRLKVINFMKRWIESYFEEDFASNPALLESLKQFVDHMAKTNKRFGQLPLKCLQRKLINWEITQQQQQQQGAENTEALSSIIVTKPANEDNDFDNLKLVFKSTYSVSSSSSSSSPSSSCSSRSPSLSEDNISEITNSTSIDEASLNLENFPPFETHLENQFPYDILTIHPLEFARQATLMEVEVFKEIKPNELTCLGWKKPDQKYKLSPNVSKLINLTNKFTYWYAKCIVDTPNLEERVAVVQRLLDIASYFYQMNNFNGMREIYGAFGTSAVHRLHITKEKSGLERTKIYAKFKELFDEHESGYIDRLKKCSPPCLPFIGKHLELIFKKHESNKLNSDNHRKQISDEQKVRLEKLFGSNETNKDIQTTNTPALINFSKYRLLIEFVSNLLQHQNVSYRFRINERIRSFILDDIENYIEEAKRSAIASKANGDDFSGMAASVTSNSLQDTIDAWLHDKSKRIEPFDVLKYPPIRNYSLKSPPPSYETPTPNTSSSLQQMMINSILKASAHKSSNISNNDHLTQSSSRLRVDKHQQKKSVSPHSKPSNSTTQSSAGLHKRSSSSSQNQFKPASAGSKQISSGTAAVTKIVTASSSSLLMSASAYSIADTSHRQQIVFPSIAVSPAASNTIVPFRLNDSQMSLNSTASSSSSSLLYSIVNNGGGNSAGVHSDRTQAANNAAQKLSLSSVDSSSSSVPNSPPPNYDEVFHHSQNHLSFSGNQQHLLNSESAQSNHWSLNQPKSANLLGEAAASESCSSILGQYPNQQGQAQSKSSSVFEFPDLSPLKLDQENNSRVVNRTAGSKKSPSLPPPPPAKPPPPPSYIPPLPPSHPPPVIRTNKPVFNPPLQQHQQSNATPPLVPPRPK